MRIAKKISETGLASRREAERWINAGRVTVNGKLIETAALNVEDSDIVLLDGNPLPAKPKTEVYAWHKPRGVLTTRTDDRGRKTIYDVLPEKYKSWLYIGRLDYDSEGLLLLTTSAELKRDMEMGDQKRVYRVNVKGTVSPKTLARLSNGISVHGIHYKPIQAKLEKQEEKSAWINVTLREGKNREIRKIFDSLQHPVFQLIRIKYGEYVLPVQNETPA